MTTEEIARLRALCVRATPGPWKQSWTWTGKHSMPMSIETQDEKRVIGTLDEYEDQSGADSAFIAESRTALPRALDEIERLRSLVAVHEANLHALLPLMTRYPLLCQKLADLGIDPDAGAK